jgi:hypothetical protein
MEPSGLVGVGCCAITSMGIARIIAAKPIKFLLENIFLTAPFLISAKKWGLMTSFLNLRGLDASAAE